MTCLGGLFHRSPGTQERPHCSSTEEQKHAKLAVLGNVCKASHVMFNRRRAKNFLGQVGLGSSRQALREGVNSGSSLIQDKRSPWEILMGNSKELRMTDFKQSVLPLPPVPGARSFCSPPP